jgi:IPTL-CTERM motif
MKRLLLAFASALLSLNAWAVTYQYTGPVYTSVTNFTPPCAGTAVCQNYSPAGQITGQFTTAAPLGANLADVSIVPQLTSYSFADGIHTISSSDSRSRVILFRVTTDLTGQITNAHISLQQWATAAVSHVTGDFFGAIFISSAGTVAAQHNETCDITLASPTDSCGVTSINPNAYSNAFAFAFGVWTTLASPAAAVATPTLSAWSLALLSVLLAGMAWGFRSRLFHRSRT